MATKSNIIKRSASENIFDVVNVIFLLLLCVVTLYPLLYVTFASLSNSSLLMQHSGLLLRPLDLTGGAYRLVFLNPNIISGFRNSLFLVVVGVPVNVFITSLGAYFMSRKGVMFQKPITFMFLFTMWFAGGMVPFYLTIHSLNLLNTLWGLIIPFMVSMYNMIVMRTSFASIPDSLEESAKLDGAGHFTILFRIVYPLSKAVIAVMVLFYGVNKWNGWFWGATLITRSELHPLQVILRSILIQNDTSMMTVGMTGADVEEASESIKYATTMVATVPILLIYPAIQKYFVKGVMIGSVKE